MSSSAIKSLVAKTVKLTFLLLTTLALVVALSSVSLAAKFAGEPFSLGVGARALALGGATVAGPFDASTVYWNPAGMRLLPRRSLLAMHSETFGSLLNHDFVGYVAPSQADSGSDSRLVKSYGFYLYYLGGGGIKLTGLDPISGRPQVISEVSHGDYALAAAVAGGSERWSFGGTIRILYRDLGVTSGYGASFDFGALYQVNPRLRLGLTINDLSSGLIRYSNGLTESITPTIRPGGHYQRALGDFLARAMISGDIRFEGRKATAQYHQGDVSLDMHYGFELAYRQVLFGRVGADVGNLTVGAGLIARSLSLDVAILRHSELDDSYRISASWNFR